MRGRVHGCIGQRFFSWLAIASYNSISLFYQSSLKVYLRIPSVFCVLEEEKYERTLVVAI